MKTFYKKALPIILSLVMVLSVFTIIPFTAGAEGEAVQNIALGKVTTVSDTEGGANGNPQNIVDGNEGTRWASVQDMKNGQTDRNNPKTVIIDLGEGQKAESVERIVVKFFNLVWAREYTISTAESLDSESWTEVYSCVRESGNNNNVNDSITYEADGEAEGHLTQNTLERYVKFTFDKLNLSAGGQGVSVKEIEIYGVLADKYPQRAIDKEILKANAKTNSYTFIQEWNDGHAAYMFDGDYDKKKWTSAYSNNAKAQNYGERGQYGLFPRDELSESTPVWVQTGFNGIKAISKIEIKNHEAANKVLADGYNLYVYTKTAEPASGKNNFASAKDSGWRKVETTFTEDTATNKSTIKLNTPTFASYVRLEITKSNHTNKLTAIVEMDIYEAEGIEPTMVDLPIDKAILKTNATTNSYSHSWNNGPASFAFDDKLASRWQTAHADINTQTYQDFTYTASIGGSNNTFYGIKQQNVSEATPAWFQTSFDEAKTISKLVYYKNQEDAGTKIKEDAFTLWVYNGDAAPAAGVNDYASVENGWTQVAVKAFQGNDNNVNTPVVIELAEPAAAKYIRLQMTGSDHTNKAISIAEMNIYEHLFEADANRILAKHTEIASGTLKNYAQANSYTNGTSGDGNAAFAFDGVENNHWHSNYGSATDTNKSGNIDGNGNVWIQTGWGDLRAISRISYKPRNGGNNAIGNCKVYYTTAAQIPDVMTSADKDGSPWKLQGTYTFGNLGNDIRNIEFEEPIVATYIRIVALSKVGNGQNYVTASYIGVFEDKTFELETVEKRDVEITADSGITPTYEVATVDGENNTVADAVATYTATISEGTEFAGWYNDNNECVSREATYYCSMQNAVNLTARTYKNDLTVKFAFNNEEIDGFGIQNVKHIFDNKLTLDEALDVVVEGEESLQEALEAYDSLKYNFEINMDEELAIDEDNTCTVQIKKTPATYTVNASVNGTTISDTKKYNENFNAITADPSNSAGESFVGWCLTDDEDEAIIATGTSYNYKATEDVDITAKYEQNPATSNDIKVYIPEPVQSIQQIDGQSYNTVEVVVSTTNVAEVNGNDVTVKSNIKSFGVVIVRNTTEAEAIKTAIKTNSGAIVRKAYDSENQENTNVALTNKGRYLHTLYFGAIPENFKIYAFAVDNDNNVTLSSGRDLQAKTAIAANTVTE